MNDNSEIPTDVNEIDELLTSYLDDELSSDERAEVESRLGRESDFRNRLAQLQRAWDLLDSLPRTEASRDFTQTTVEMVAQRAVSDSQAMPAAGSRRNLRAGFLVIVGSLLAASAGFLAVYAILDAPNRRLISDLPVLENFDEYRYAESVEFLEMLDQEGLFEEASDESI